MRSSLLRHIASVAAAAVSVCGLVLPMASNAQSSSAVGVAGGVARIAQQTLNQGHVGPCSIDPAQSDKSGTASHECSTASMKAAHARDNDRNTSTHLAQVMPR